MRVEVTDHAADRGFEQVTIVNGLDIIPFDALHDLGEQLRLLQRELLVARHLRLV